MDGQSEWLLSTLSKIGYGLFSYALRPAKRTSASFMGAILEEYLVFRLTQILDERQLSKLAGNRPQVFTVA